MVVMRFNMSLITTVQYIENESIDQYLPIDDLSLHDYLTDNADWNNEFWEFEPKFIKHYGEKILAVFNESVNGITFQAIWAGETPINTENLTIEQFLDVIEQNKIATKTKYVVRKYA